MQTLHENPVKISFTAQQIIAGLKEEKDDNNRRIFQNLFYSKYVNYIYKGATNLCRNFPEPEELAKDITQEAFIKAFEKIQSFNLSKEADERKHEYMIKAWMGRIANNCFLKLYAKRKNEVYENEEGYLDANDEQYDMFQSLFGETQLEVLSVNRIRLQEALNSLKEEHRHILLTYAREGCINSTQHLSDAAMEYLCKTHDTNSDYIRQIKHRSLKNIKKQLFQE
jgi:RNA polymerase sigma factor (sigma-70 family)